MKKRKHQSVVVSHAVGVQGGVEGEGVETYRYVIRVSSRSRYQSVSMEYGVQLVLLSGNVSRHVLTCSNRLHYNPSLQEFQ